MSTSAQDRTGPPPGAPRVLAGRYRLAGLAAGVVLLHYRYQGTFFILGFAHAQQHGRAIRKLRRQHAPENG